MARLVQTRVARIPRVRAPKAVRAPKPPKPPKAVSLPGVTLGRTSNRSPRAGAHVHHHHATPHVPHAHAHHVPHHTPHHAAPKPHAGHRRHKHR